MGVPLRDLHDPERLSNPSGRRMVVLKLIAGLVLLIVGAESLVRGASRIATVIGVSPLVIGLTVVAFGTSSPELGVSMMSALDGNPGIALGNVVGSNIFNVLLILGVSALITPLIVAQQLIRLDVPVMIGVSLLVLLFGFDGRVETWEAGLLVVCGILYTTYVIRLSRKEKDREVIKEYEEAYGEKQSRIQSTGVALILILAGLGSLMLGARWLVDGAVFLAHRFGVSDLVIGLTVIAVGTSLPEVATSVIASMRGEKDIAVGNVIGSNIFNLVFILGITGMISPVGVPIPAQALSFDIPVMIAVAIACLPIFLTGRRLDRWEGGVFLFYYIAYTIYLILAQREAESLEVFSRGMIWFAVPLTLLTLGVAASREYRNTQKQKI